MLIKSADDKQPDIDTLNGLLARPGLDTAGRRRIETELRRVQAGWRGEREAAYEIEFYYGANPNRMTIHDLRLEVDGRIAQIDHLLIDRPWVRVGEFFRLAVRRRAAEIVVVHIEATLEPRQRSTRRRLGGARARQPGLSAAFRSLTAGPSRR